MFTQPILQEDWNFVREPVSSAEVIEAIHSLSAISNPRTGARSEGSWTSSDISDDLHANELIANADRTVAVADLSNIVCDMLNDPITGPAISDNLRRNTEYRRIIEQYTPTAQLPPNARVLALPGPEGWRPAVERGPSPLDAFVDFVVTAMCNLGNAVRRLPNDIAFLL